MVEFRRSALALAILGLLDAEPTHPYGIARRIKEWGKEDVVNVSQRAGLYKTIARLEQAGLVTASGTDRDPRYPERTTYAITDAGRELARRWLAEMIESSRNEFPDFPAALSFVPMLTARAARDLLERRRGSLAARVAELDAQLANAAADFPRVVLLDGEYQLAVLRAELAWVSKVVADLAAGRLDWDIDELRRIARRDD